MNAKNVIKIVKSVLFLLIFKDNKLAQSVRINIIMIYLFSNVLNHVKLEIEQTKSIKSVKNAQFLIVLCVKTMQIVVRSA